MAYDALHQKQSADMASAAALRGWFDPEIPRVLNPSGDVRPPWAMSYTPAQWAALGKLKPGDDFVHESIIGTMFKGRVEKATRAGTHDAMPKGQLLPTKDAEVAAHIGPMLTYADVAKLAAGKTRAEGYRAISQHVEGIVRRLAPKDQAWTLGPSGTTPLVAWNARHGAASDDDGAADAGGGDAGPFDGALAVARALLKTGDGPPPEPGADHGGGEGAS